jgi:hypothetical protein
MQNNEPEVHIETYLKDGIFIIEQTIDAGTRRVFLPEEIAVQIAADIFNIYGWDKL